MSVSSYAGVGAGDLLLLLFALLYWNVSHSVRSLGLGVGGNFGDSLLGAGAAVC